MPKPRRPRTPRTPTERPKPPVRPLDTTDVVLTPGGLRPRSLVHVLQPGEHVSLKDGHVRIIETATGNVVKDLGEVAAEGEEEAEPSGGADESEPGLQDIGWIENAQWRNGGTDPIISFTTTWIVPPTPSSSDSQTVYLFNGMQPDNAAHILQPVLQWGPSYAGGGNYWSIANWYADGQGGAATVKTPVQVSPGTVLQGVMTCTSQSSSGYNYTCQFIGYPSVDITVTDAPELTWAYETLECYGPYTGTNSQGVPQFSPLAQCSDYPATTLTAMYDIEIKTGTPGSSGTDAAISWQRVTNFTDCGQSCEIVSNDSPGGAVYLYYSQPAQNFYFVNDKSSFGKDEVADVIKNSNGVFPAAFYLALEGFSVQQLTIDQPSLIAPSLSGPFATLTGVTVTPSQTYQPFYDPTNLYTPQRILYPFDIIFTSEALGDFPATGVTAELLNASITTGSAVLGTEQQLTASTVLELVAGADPYFSNIDPQQHNVFYRSQDLRVFTITPQANNATPIDNVPFTFQGGSPTSFDSAAAYSYIRALITHFNSTYSDPSGVDPFDLTNPKLPGQNNVYGGDSTVTPASLNPADPFELLYNYNFALARVRLQGPSGPPGEAPNVRVFFRLFTTQTFDTDYINTAQGVSAGDPNITYPSLPTSSPNAPTSPLPGTNAQGTINGSSLPFFAAADQSDLDVGGVNNTSIIIPAGSDQAWTYFGCFLNVYDPAYLIGGQDSQYWLAGSSHSCLVAQIAYSGVPIENTDGVIENPENCVQLAQRNLQITLSGNPGFPAAHLIPQTFDTRPSPPPAAGALAAYPDELMIDWRSTPAGSTAQIYWPAVNASDVLALAAELYPASSLASVDAHTLSCPVTPGMTYIPVPPGTGESFAGLITVQLPDGIRAGEEFAIVIRRVTSRRLDERIQAQDTAATSSAAATSSPALINWRYIVGTFQMTIPVKHDAAILPSEENLLAILRWRLQLLTSQNRWYPVLERYIDVVAQRVHGLGGDPAKIPPSPVGLAPPKRPHEPPEPTRRVEYTGKVTGLRYDRFGDFDGFDLVTLHGEERCFSSREPRVETLVREAWMERHLLTVIVTRDHTRWPAEIILRRT